MKQQFSTDRHEQRRVLLAAVDSIRDTLAANADEAEALRTLPPASVTALRESGLFALMVPMELGGAETDPMTQLEVFEAVSFIDPSTGWSYAIGAGTLVFSAYLPNEAIARMFADGRTPICAAAYARSSRAGGGRLPRHWSLVLGQRYSSL